MVIIFRQDSKVVESTGLQIRPRKGVVGSNPTLVSKADVTQLVECETENLEVSGSIPDVGTNSGSSKGKTSDFDSDNGGSNPSPETKFDRKKYQMLFMRDKRKADKLGLKVSEYRKLKGDEMSEIPKDIIEKAKKAAMKIAAVIPIHNSDDVNVIAKAIASERDRCIRIIESFGYDGSRYDFDGVSPYEISSAVRKEELQ